MKGESIFFLHTKYRNSLCTAFKKMFVFAFHILLTINHIQLDSNQSSTKETSRQESFLLLKTEGSLEFPHKD